MSIESEKVTLLHIITLNLKCVFKFCICIRYKAKATNTGIVMVQENIRDRREGEIYIISKEYLDSAVYAILNIANSNKRQKTNASASNITNEDNQKQKQNKPTTLPNTNDEVNKQLNTTEAVEIANKSQRPTSDDVVDGQPSTTEKNAEQKILDKKETLNETLSGNNKNQNKKQSEAEDLNFDSEIIKDTTKNDIPNDSNEKASGNTNDISTLSTANKITMKIDNLQNKPTKSIDSSESKIDTKFSSPSENDDSNEPQSDITKATLNEIKSGSAADNESTTNKDKQQSNAINSTDNSESEHKITKASSSNSNIETEQQLISENPRYDSNDLDNIITESDKPQGKPTNSSESQVSNDTTESPSNITEESIEPSNTTELPSNITEKTTEPLSKAEQHHHDFDDNKKLNPKASGVTALPSEETNMNRKKSQRMKMIQFPNIHLP